MKPLKNCVQSIGEIEESIGVINRKGWPLHRWNHMKNWDTRWLEPVMRSGDLLDIGCVTSMPLEIAVTLNLCGRKVGVDPVGEYRCFERGDWRIPGRCEFFRAKAESLPFADGSFDWVTCLSVIEHGVDLGEFSREVGRVTRAGGVLVVTFDYWPVKVEGALDGGEVHVLKMELERAGFLIEAHDLSVGEAVVDGRFTFGALVCRRV